MISAHPIVTATFHGHEHLKSVVFFGSPDTRLTMSHPYAQVISGGAGGDTYPCSRQLNTSTTGRQSDYCGSYEGFANVTVNGGSVTVDFYQAGNTAPIKSISFTK
jgi:hypothetical protein